MCSLRKTSYQLFTALNRVAARELRFMKRNQWLTPIEIAAIQEERLESLIVYSYHHVPYFRKAFDRVGLIAHGSVRLDRFDQLPVLDKPGIRRDYHALTSDESRSLHAFENRTGGSTGEPLVVLQDRDGVRRSGSAVLRFFYDWHGIGVGDREVKVWGLEADLFYPSRFSFKSIVEWASGIRMLNAFRMTPETMHDYIRFLGEYHPLVLRGYSANLYELALFVEEHKLHIHPPRIVVSSAGTLYDHLREKISSVFGAPVFNHYGSREMHNMAMECPQSSGLHINAFTHMIEVVDDRGQACPPGVEGDLVVTSLVNRAMPLIRYRIGDRGALAGVPCRCGRGLPVLATLSGRRVDCLHTRDGSVIPGLFFVHLLGVHLKNHPVDKFQVIQESYNSVRFRLVLNQVENLPPETSDELREKTRLVMGERCKIEIDVVDEIKPLPSGKYQYIKCMLPESQGGA